VKEAMPKLKDAAFKDYAETLRGLSGFQVEQSAAMAMSDLGINRAVLWEQKKQIIKTAKGLSVDEDALTLADIGGSSAIVEFGHRVFNGRKKPTAVVRVEEIEKKMGTEDRVSTSDVSADALDVYLNAMEDYGWGGVIALGPPGTGKSYFAKCLANTYGAISLAQDINATRGRYVGDSEKGIRENIKMIHAIGGSNVFFVATCNKLSTLPAALRRRFWMGTYFFDLPDEEEQMAVWKLCFARKGWKLGTKDPKFELPNFKDWTQAEIRNCVEFAWNFDCSLKEASGYILPTATSDAEGIKTLREAADGKFLSAAYKGAYHMKKEEQIARKIR
jgi:SpoVK/Ycf46/Vps4 family AAA+-type ATPase